MIARGEPFAVVVPTRNRAAQLDRLLDSLAQQTQKDFDVVVVDQSDEPDASLARRAEDEPRLHVLRDDGRGASRARNVGWRAVGSDWIAYLDDDCIPEADWVAALRAELASEPAAQLITGDVGAHNAPGGDYLPVAVFPVSEERILKGRLVRPWRVGYSLAMAIRRATLAELGGWDERFGPGVPEYPASDDMDLNYRLLRSGGAAYLTPRLRASHDQWRTSEELVRLYSGYSRAWGGLVAKLVRTGDPIGALLLTGGRVRGLVRRFGSAVTGRSRFRLRFAAAETRGFLTGLARGLRQSW